MVTASGPEPVRDAGPVQGPGRRRRRSTAEVRSALIEAAQTVFAAHGYSGSTTREIAQLAGTNDILIYRHFGSKAELFEQAVLDPFSQFVADYLATWDEDHADAEPMAVLCQRYAEGLHDLMYRQRHLTMALLTAQAYRGEGLDPATGRGGPAAIDALLDRVQAHVTALNKHYRWHDVDSDFLTVRVTFAMIIGVVLTEDWLFSRGRRPSNKRLVQEIARFIHHRVTYRPDGGETSP